jgi:hypothetical protein
MNQRRSRTLRKDVAASVAFIALAELVTINAALRCASASRTGHAGFVGTQQRTNIFVRENCRRCAWES